MNPNMMPTSANAIVEAWHKSWEEDVKHTEKLAKVRDPRELKRGRFAQIEEMKQRRLEQQ